MGGTGGIFFAMVVVIGGNGGKVGPIVDLVLPDPDRGFGDRGILEGKKRDNLLNFFPYRAIE